VESVIPAEAGIQQRRLWSSLWRLGLDPSVRGGGNARTREAAERK
jgi:hypothetical protein